MFILENTDINTCLSVKPDAYWKYVSEKKILEAKKKKYYSYFQQQVAWLSTMDLT